jgi:hypothetical protein
MANNQMLANNKDRLEKCVFKVQGNETQAALFPHSLTGRPGAGSFPGWIVQYARADRNV